MSDNQSKEQPIKGWVKASEKLPDNTGKYICRLIATQGITTLVYFAGEFETSYPLNTFEYLDETPIQSGEERWISVEDRPLFTKDKDNIWTLTEDGSKEFFAAVPYNDKQQPGKELWWIRHCIIEGETGLCVVTDDGYEPAGWGFEDITYWRPFFKPPNGEQKSNAGEERLLREALENLLEAIHKQTEDADWWEDDLTRAVGKAKQLLNY